LAPSATGLGAGLFDGLGGLVLMLFLAVFVYFASNFQLLRAVIIYWLFHGFCRFLVQKKSTDNLDPRIRRGLPPAAPLSR
jgi:hypothetical protein